MFHGTEEPPHRSARVRRRPGVSSHTAVVAAPGLLPFVVGFSLLLMAVALGALAVRDGGARNLFGGFGGAGAWAIQSTIGSFPACRSKT